MDVRRVSLPIVNNGKRTQEVVLEPISTFFQVGPGVTLTICYAVDVSEMPSVQIEIDENSALVIHANHPFEVWKDGELVHEMYPPEYGSAE